MKKSSKNKYKLISYVSILLLTAITLFSFIPQNASALSDRDDTIIASRFGELLFGEGTKAAKNRLKLTPGGDVFGVKLDGVGVTVGRVISDSTPLLEGDKLERINGTEIFSGEDISDILNKSGNIITLDIIRNGKHLTLSTTKVSDSKLPLGVTINDTAAGIGTVTFINPENGEFGGLGHGICDSDSGKLLPMRTGIASGVILGGATRGESGKPGELRGILTATPLGTILGNTELGIFGNFNQSGLEKKCKDEAIEVATPKEVTEGPAEIISTVKGTARAKYSIEISDIDYTGDVKSFKIHVTDETLIALTGGIVRGMSGSPIIQNGRLVGAVTHVMISSPTDGYGVFIENMLWAKNNLQKVKDAA